MLDSMLAFALLIAFPAYATWRNFCSQLPIRDNRSRYLRTIFLIGSLLLLLTASWLYHSRDIISLGLSLPTAPLAMSGFAVGAAMLLLLLVAVAQVPLGGEPGEQDTLASILPRSANELWLFAAFSFFAGFGWEVLYRGFLLFYLVPIIGLPMSVAVASIAYGISHGVKDTKRLAGSIAFAFVFTAGYVLTGSLWWLVLIHIALPLTAMAMHGKILKKSVSHPEA